MAFTVATPNSASAWRPDQYTFAPTDVVPDALINQCSTVAGTIEGDARPNLVRGQTYCEEHRREHGRGRTVADAVSHGLGLAGTPSRRTAAGSIPNPVGRCPVKPTGLAPQARYAPTVNLPSRFGLGTVCPILHVTRYPIESAVKYTSVDVATWMLPTADTTARAPSSDTLLAVADSFNFRSSAHPNGPTTMCPQRQSARTAGSDGDKFPTFVPGCPRSVVRGLPPESLSGLDDAATCGYRCRVVYNSVVAQHHSRYLTY